ncbi:hypothetical protein CT694_34590 (plasmid) [Bacillus wiedmannii bv. thuringiensis]|nr:hypothetical protein CT694_34590 [Bacillus wiedmannii bv. thuringiensis]
MYNFVPPQPERRAEKEKVPTKDFKKISVIPNSGYVLFGFYGFQPTDGKVHKVYPVEIHPTVIGDALDIIFYNDEGTDVEMEVFTWEIKKPN